VIILNTKKVKCVIVDRNAPQFLFDYLDEQKIEYIKSEYIKNVIEAVSTHPDMQICRVRENTYVCDPSVFEYYIKKLNKYDVKLIKGETYISSTYPYDISYNVVVSNSIAFHTLKYTDPSVLKEIENTDISIYNVKQGYTKCATCIIGDRAFITADFGIYNMCVENNIKCLLIDKASIKLGETYDGFIGGCCGMISEDTLLFCGDLSTHPSYNDIVEFSSQYRINIISASNDELTDIGSIIPII